MDRLSREIKGREVWVRTMSFSVAPGVGPEARILRPVSDASLSGDLGRIQDPSPLRHSDFAVSTAAPRSVVHLDASAVQESLSRCCSPLLASPEAAFPGISCSLDGRSGGDAETLCLLTGHAAIGSPPCRRVRRIDYLALRCVLPSLVS